jgi:hypothetical protein
LGQRELFHIDAINRNRSAQDIHATHKGTNHCALSRSVRSCESRELPGVGFERDAVYGMLVSSRVCDNKIRDADHVVRLN